ncbi:MAG: hypothetical protein ACRDS9_25925 [Pseudonocardiaceae bacterium]
MPSRSGFVVVIERGQMGMDIVGVGDAKAGVEVQGVAPVVAGLVELAGGVVGPLRDLGVSVSGTLTSWPTKGLT